MDCKLAALVIGLCVSVTAAAHPSRGYIMEVPRTLQTESTNLFLLQTFHIDAPGTVTLSLLKRENDTELAKKVVNLDKGDESVQIPLFVPRMDEEYSCRFQFQGSFETDDNYTAYAIDTVNLQKVYPHVVFIQTDKPLYKPGQTIMMRVLRLDREFHHIKKPAHAEMYIEDPAGSRLAQWKDLKLTNMEQFEFQLSDEPVEGAWKISVNINGTIETTTIEVKEYVLPTFSVVIKPPSYIIADAQTIDIEICARYTYGKLVEGKLKLNASLEKYGWQMEKGPTLEEEQNIDGCYSYSLNVSLIEQESYSYRRIKIVASVTEKGTEIERNETKYLDRTLQPLNLNFCERNRNSNSFKPGLPYRSCLKVTKPDSTPAEDEEIEMCHTVSRERIMYNWLSQRKVKICKNFTSDSEGIIRFTLPPQNTDTTGINIEAKSTKYVNKPSPVNRVTLSQPQTSTSLKPWYSRSGSYLQIQAISNPLPCDTEQKIQILYTAKEPLDTLMYYQVMNKGRVVTSGEISLSCDADDVSCQFLESENVFDGDEIQIVPPASSVKNGTEEEDCPSAKEARYVPPVGSKFISIDVNPYYSSNFFVLAYYIREDREVVADSEKFIVEKCFNNKVSMQFGDEEKQPGTKTTVTLKASPDSLCGIKVVDKSVSLLDSSDQLTLTSVFNAYQRFYIGPYYSKNHCTQAVNQPGLGQKFVSSDYIIPPRPWSQSMYDDSMTAYENTGITAFSDMDIVTSPCKPNEYSNQHFSAGYGGMGKGGAGPVALASTARRPPPPAQDSMPEMDSVSLKSVKDVRTDFPETWLFKLVLIGEEGKLVQKETLPDTITEWVGSAVCLNSEDGLGISNTTAIKGFQPFFLTVTVPYSMIRGEKLWIPIVLFNYIDKALPITLSMDESDDYILTDGPLNEDVCVLPSKSESRKVQIMSKILGPLNVTIRAKTAESNDVCGDHPTSNRIASDGVKKSLIIKPEGFPNEIVQSTIFCPKDSEDGVFKKDFTLGLPDDVVPDSSRAFLVVTGNIMGPALDNLDHLVRLPTGCGEQNMVMFAPISSILRYLASMELLSKELETKAKGFLARGYTRELSYRHSDGSFSAFGASDKEGSIFLTAFVVRSFTESKNYTYIDAEKLAQSEKWITSKQQGDGSYPNVGRTVDQQWKGGDKESAGLRTAYVLGCLLTAGYKNQTAIDLALGYMKKHDENLTAYSAALYAYTTALAGKKDMAEKYISNVYNFANKTGDMVHFNIVNGSDSPKIETAATTALAIMELDGSSDKVLPIIRFLSKMRNSYGGFSSTQDTVMGLKALATFAERLGKDKLSLEVIASEGWNDELQIDNENKLLVNQAKISVPSELNVEATGSGCGLIQATLRYNTFSAPEKKLFSLTVDTNCHAGDCTKVSLYIELRYVPTGQKSNMAVVEIDMQTGLAAMKDSLDKLVYKGSPVRRFDIKNNVVYCYIYEVSNEPISFVVELEKLSDVDDLKPAQVKVYDYYATDKMAIATYDINNKVKGSENDSGKDEKENEKTNDKDEEKDDEEVSEKENDEASE